jgi:hypothetical protein
MEIKKHAILKTLLYNGHNDRRSLLTKPTILSFKTS